MVTPSRLYSLYCTLHSHSSRRLQEAHVTRSLSFSPVRETISYFAVYGPAATIFFFFYSIFAQISLRNLQTTQFCWREAGVITVLNFFHLSSYTTVPFRVHILLYLLTAQIQQCRCTDPGPSWSQCFHSNSGRFYPIFLFWVVCVIFWPTENIFCTSIVFNPIHLFQVVCVTFWPTNFFIIFVQTICFLLFVYT